jgi:hypothetical protein
MSSITGVAGEERRDFDKGERRVLRRRSLKLLGSLLAPLRRKLILTALVVVVSTALQVIGPAVIAYGIDAGLPALLKGQGAPLFVSVAVYLVAGVASGILIAAYTVQTARISQAVLIDLRERVFVQTQRLSLEFHESYTSGRIISRQTSDLDSIRELLDGGINELVQSVLYMAFTAVALVLLDGWSGLILFCSFVPLAVLIRWFQRRSEATFRESRVFSAKLIVFFVETMTGIRAVQAFRKEPRNARDYGVLTEDYRAINARAIRLFAVLEPGLTLIGNLTTAAVLLFGAYRVLDGDLAVGVLLAAVLYSRRFFDPMEDIATFYNAYQSAEAALEKISGVLEESPTVPEPLTPQPLGTGVTGRVRFDGVRFAYRADREVLPHFDLDVPAGRFDGRGQVHAGEAHRAVLRPHRGADHPRRRGPAGPDEPGPPSRRRDGDAGGVPVLRLGRGQHRARASRGDPGRDRGRVGGRRRGRVHPVPARRVRHGREQARRPGVGRAAPADLVRPGVPRGSGGADPRRGHGLPRHPERAAGAGGAADAARRPHRADHRAPAVDGAHRRPRPRDGARADRRGRHPGGPDRRHRPLRRPPRRLARLPGLTRSTPSTWSAACSYAGTYVARRRSIR